MASKFRCQLEVLRFLPVQDSLRTAAVLSTAWFKATESEELWGDYCSLFNIDTESRGHILVKTHFQKNYCEPKLIPVITKTALNLYSVPNLEEKSVELSIPYCIDTLMSYCFLEYKTLMISALRRSNVHIYKISVTTGEVTPLSQMRIIRLMGSLFKYQRKVYCFGGTSLSSKLRSIERYNIDTDKWTEVHTALSHQMTTISPIRSGNQLYLVDSLYIDVFDLRTEEVSPFPLQFPTSGLPSVVCVTPQDELVVVQRDAVMKCSLLYTPDHFDIATIETLRDGRSWSIFPVVVVGTAVFRLYYRQGQVEGIVRFELETYKLEEVKKVRVA